MLVIFILVVILIFCLFDLSSELGTKGDSVIDGIGKMSDSKEKIFKKISWLSDYEKRVDCKSRIYVISFVIGVLISLVMYNYFPNEKIILYSTIIVFFVLFCSQNFFSYHSSRALPYYIKRNIELLKGKVFDNKKPTHTDINIFNATHYEN